MLSLESFIDNRLRKNELKTAWTPITTRVIASSDGRSIPPELKPHMSQRISMLASMAKPAPAVNAPNRIPFSRLRIFIPFVIRASLRNKPIESAYIRADNPRVAIWKPRMAKILPTTM